MKPWINTFIISAALMISSGGCRDRPYGSASPPDPSGAPGERVISLAPSLTEMIAAIGAGDQLVGRSSACDYPPEIMEAVPAVGGFGEPSLEALLARNPSLVVDVALADKTLEHRMRTAGLRRIHIPCEKLDDIPDALRRLGDLLHRPAEAETLAAGLESALADLRTASADDASKRPLVFVELWSDPLMTIGRTSYIAECIRLAGGENLGDEQNRDYYYISHERIIERNPDVILVFYMAGASPADQIAGRIGWEDVAAVRQRRIYADFDHDTILRPGPRVLQGIEQLRASITARGTSAMEAQP